MSTKSPNNQSKLEWRSVWLSVGVAAMYLIFYLAIDQTFRRYVILLALIMAAFTLLARYNIAHLLNGNLALLQERALWAIVLVCSIYFLFQLKLKPQDIVSAIVGGAAAIFAFQQVVLNRRIAWFTGSQESHSAVRLIMEAHDHGLPVMWWDPTKEAYDPRTMLYGGDRHRMLAKQPYVVLMVPEEERARRTKKHVKSASPLTSAELQMIEAKRRQLQRRHRISSR